MEKRLFSNSIFQKLVAVIAAVVMILTVAPISGIFDLELNASAEIPVYDKTLGTYSQAGSVLTATPNEGAGFRGWFHKDGTEVSYDTTFTLPSGETASDYIPVFYNHNLIKKGSFEEFKRGDKLSTADFPEDEMWKGYTTDSPNWTSATVTNAAARTGYLSLLLNAPHNASYKEILNLKPNTQYTLTYYFNMVGKSESDYLDKSYIISGDITEDKLLGDVPYLDVKDYDYASSNCVDKKDWKKVTHTFFTGDNTSVKLLIRYVNQPDANGTRASFYVDDVCLLEDPTLAPANYFNEDFSMSSVANWSSLKNATLYHNNGKLNASVSSGSQFIQYKPFLAKKGASYTISFNFNFGTLVNESENYINFSLTNTKGKAFEVGYYIQNVKGANDFKAWLYQGSNSFDISTYFSNGEYTNTCIKKENLTKFDTSADINVELSFTADKNTPVYLNVWSNKSGQYTIDDLVVSESNVPTGATLAAHYAASLVGTAIRTEGVQGMRYKTQIDKRLLTANNYYGLRVVEYGTIAIKTVYLNGKELTYGGTYQYGGKTYSAKSGAAYSFADKTDLIYENNSTTLDFTGVLVGISEANYNTNYTARAYFKYVDSNGATGYFYADQNNIAVYPVAKMAYSAKKADGSYNESETVRDYLYNNIVTKFTDKIIKVSNKANPVATNFEGIRSTIYHGTIFFDDSHNRTYTPAQAAVEMDRLVDTKVDNVRTRFDSHWSWNDGWNWNSDKMNKFYQWGEMLEDRGISITIQAGWHLYDFICFYNKQYNTGITDPQDTDGDGHSSIPEVNYLHGYADDGVTAVSSRYGEDALAATIKADATTIGLNLNENELTHYSLASARYGTWIAEGIKALRAKGLSNIEYIIPFTESGDAREGDATYSYDEWIIMTMGLQKALEQNNLRNTVKVIGPAQSIYANQNRLSLVEYIYEKINATAYANMIDINAMHQYTRPNYEAGYANTGYDPDSSYSLAEENFNYYNNVLTNTGERSKEFWCDEYFSHAPDFKWWNNVGMQMTQFAAGLTAGINTGVNRFLTWQMFDTLWDSDAIQGEGIITNNSEFSGGIHAVGTCTALVHVDGKTCPNGSTCRCTAYYNISSYVPRVTYYGINLIGKYMNNEDALVYSTEVVDAASSNGGVFVSSILNDDGKIVILVVNTNASLTNVDIQLDDAMDVKEFNRYAYDPSAITPTAEAKSLPSDRTVNVNGNSIIDDIPPQSFAIYVEGSKLIGDDTNLDMGELWK